MPDERDDAELLKILDEVINPETFHAAKEREWLLTRDDESGRLCYEAQSEFGVVSVTIRDPLPLLRRVMRWSQDRHKAVVTGPKGETIIGTDVGDDLTYAINKNAQATVIYLLWLLGHNAAELLGETYRESVAASHIFSQFF